MRIEVATGPIIAIDSSVVNRATNNKLKYA